ncbi:MAG: exodeoxyribonuclease V subunit gamma [Gemmatimonadetes bacterium]|nr:exodeoxyribonuclease V subunit gamma [Gemmatimonadota bacterium]
MHPPATAAGSSLRLVTGSSPHALLAQLDADAREAGLTPFDDETIVVQSRGMERWIRQELAVRRGCAAALDVYFPVGFCGRLARVRPAEPPDAAFEREALTWRLTTLLGALDVDAIDDGSVWAPLRTYLARGDAAGRFALARRIATLFDNYRLYRPWLLLHWEGEQVPTAQQATIAAAEASPHAAWQRALWQQLTAGARPRHFARWLLETTAWLTRLDAAPDDLPRWVTVFGISTLPPAFVELLQALARLVPVTAYVLTPRDHVRDHAHDHVARHALDEQMGGTSRELLALLGASAPDVHMRHLAAPDTPARDTTLAHVQAALRHGAAAAPHAVDAHVVDAHDRSLLVHDCHSPVRELEVLYDQLLDAFAADPSLRPHDVLVMVPDVDRYAAPAAMVFGPSRRAGGGARGEADDRPAIPWRVADRAPDQATAPARAFAQLLALVDSRFTASAVIDLLASAPVARAAGLEGADVEQVTRWTADARIHWGVDGLMRADFGLPSLEEHTWRLGVDRLVAGHAAGAREALVLGVLPTAGDTGGDAPLLGRFVEWVEQLALRAESLSAPRSLLAWSLAFDAALDWLLRPDGHAEEAACARIRRDIARLRGAMEMDDALGAPQDTSALPEDTLVPLDVARRWLLEALGTEQHDAGFLSGGLTLCAMKPMRAIPFRFIAMLGLDDRAFPRRERRPAFDLQGVAPLAGDRDVRADDRQLFLDTVLCAQERLHLSWVGRSQSDNAAVAPSVVLSELLDQLDAMCVVMSARDVPAPARTRLLVSHALQPFSVSYFDGSDPHRFTFDARWQPPARAEAARPLALTFLDDAPESAAGHAPAQATSAPHLITVDSLVRAWTDPAAWYARHVLQLRLAGVDDDVDDVEPLVVDALQRTRLLEPLLSRAMRTGVRDARPEGSRAGLLLAHGGSLPPGALTAEWSARLFAQRDLLLDAAMDGVPDARLSAPLSVELHGAGWVLTGQLDGQVPDGQRFVRGAAVREKDRIRAWILHCVRGAAGHAGETRLVGLQRKDGVDRAEVVTLRPVGTPMAVLETLVAFHDALSRAPQPFFPRSAFAWWKKRDAVDAQHIALDVFTTSGQYTSAEGADAHVALLWRGRDPLTEQWDRFAEVATTLLEPMDAAGGVS